MIRFASLFMLALLLSGCNSDLKNRKTTVEIIDNDRHYWPVLRGQELDIVFYINNTGKNPLLISDVITSCGCLVLSDGSNLTYVPSGKQGILRMTYDSRKNVGLAKHYVGLYGNFEAAEMKELVFQVNVVPNALYTKDYEELYYEELGGRWRAMMDGNTHKGYFMPDDF